MDCLLARLARALVTISKKKGEPIMINIFITILIHGFPLWNISVR